MNQLLQAGYFLTKWVIGDKATDILARPMGNTERQSELGVMRKTLLAMLLLSGLRFAHPQASPFSNSVFAARTFTAGAFSKTSAASTTFTLSATKGTTKTSTATINWLARTFAGIGAAGATSSVTASGTNAVLSTGATLASAGLGNATTYGPVSPSAQKVYILMVGGSHTFKDSGTGFSFAFNAPTSVSFVNANGSSVAMFLYESTNTLSGTFSIQVVN